MKSNDPFLFSLGWNDFFQSDFDGGTGIEPGRVISQGKGHYQVQVSSDEVLEAAVTTKFHDAAADSTGFPTVGDWVALQREQGHSHSAIHQVLERKNALRRKKSGAQQGIQMIAANVDFLFVVSSLNEDFDLSRLGRYVGLGRECGCETILLLTKTDLSPNPQEFIDRCKASFEGIETLAISSESPTAMDRLQDYFAPGKTGVLLGSSGVGKSTLTNYLLGFAAQKTGSLSSESKGRHTTTARNLRFTRWGGMVIDTPGMQEISSVNSGDELSKNFSDIDDLKLRCKFTNCAHVSEPGCAILAALGNGTLDIERWHRYLGVEAKGERRQKKNKYTR